MKGGGTEEEEEASAVSLTFYKRFFFNNIFFQKNAHVHNFRGNRVFCIKELFRLVVVVDISHMGHKQLLF